MPKVLRLPTMEDHQFFNRERLMELSKLEFEMFANLKETDQVPPVEYLFDSSNGLVTFVVARKK